MSDDALLEIIRRYTREAGVRNLEREIASVCRKVARKLVEGKEADKPFVVTVQNLQTYLGIPKHRYGEMEPVPRVGLCTGMCCKVQPDRIIDKAVALGVDAVVCPCSGCTPALRLAGEGKLPVLHYTELLVRCLEEETGCPI